MAHGEMPIYISEAPGHKSANAVKVALGGGGAGLLVAPPRV